MPEYSAPIGAPIWFDLVSSDPDRVAPFYHELFGWDAEQPDPEFGGYRNFTRNGKRVAGLMGFSEGNGCPNVWTVYLHTSDAADTASSVEAAGGSVMVTPMPVGDLGTMLVTADSAGAVIGFWEPGSHPGFVEWGEHGTPYWFECQSLDYIASRAFYPKVTGARLEEVGTGGDPNSVGPDHYSQVFNGELSYSGIMDSAKLLPAGSPSFWQVYITVDDVAGTVQQAEALGGEIVMGVEDTPYGTLAAIKDPLGATVCLGHPPVGS